MYKLSIHLVVTYFPTELVIKVNPNINSVEVHPQLSNNRQEDPGLFRTTKNRARVLMVWEISM
jgi:hypothetical protein